MFLKVENKSQWRSLLDKALFKTFFHSVEWENFLENEFSWIRFERYLWKDELLLSIARCKLFGKEKFVSHPLCEYGGPMPLKEKIDWESFSQDFQQFFGNKAKIKFHPYIQPSNPLENNSVPQVHDLSTFWIEDFSKKSLEDLWRGFRKTLRHEIGKREGLHIAECDTEKDLKCFYDMYIKTVVRHKNIPFPFSVFKFFNDSRGASVVLAKREGMVAGGSIFLFYEPFIHYFISASGQKFRSAHIGHKILWHVMQEYVGGPTSHIKYDYFDLGGTRKGSALEVFKRGWGAKEYPLYEMGRKSGGLRNSFLRGILGLIPAVVMKRLAPLALWTKI